ncbi:hypothetical protein P8452_43866 [Trifolium repens]|nr:hypothetical protein P8452_43866 [Trifolium repens]
MSTNIRSLYFIFAIISIASIVASAGTNKSNVFVCAPNHYGCCLTSSAGTNKSNNVVCAPNHYGCCLTCAFYGLHGKCYKNKCCCSAGSVQGSSNRDFCIWPSNLALCR